MVLGPPGDDFICHILRVGASLPDIEDALSEARAFSGIVILTHDPSGILREGEELTGDMVRQLVRGVAGAMFEAFDDFGWIVWRPPATPGGSISD